MLLTAAAKDVVDNVALNLGRALDSPLGKVAQREIAKKLLGDPGANPQQLSRTFEGADAEVVRGHTDEQAEPMESFLRAGVDLASIEAEDRANARAARPILNMVIGALVVLCKEGLQYLLGSSKSSKNKSGWRQIGCTPQGCGGLRL